MTENYFRPTYKEARTEFRYAARAAGAEQTVHQHPVVRGPEREELTTDIAIIGNRRNPKRVLVLSSGVHGVEGYFGGAVLTAALRDLSWQSKLPPDMAVVFVHAVNPHGMANKRRVDENNVDPNRNAVDFGKPIQFNQKYDAYRNIVQPNSWDEVPAAVDDLIERYRKDPQATLAALQNGQWQHNKGLFYGGTKPGFSRQVMESVFQRFHNAERLVYVDYHTGLGEHGVPTLLTDYPRGTPARDRTEKIWAGQIVQGPDAGTDAVSAATYGCLTDLAEKLSGEVTTVTHELGTRSVPQLISALLRENWLRQLGNPPADLLERENVSPLAKMFLRSVSPAEIRADMLDAFYPQGEDRMAWETRVQADGLRTFRQALTALQAKPKPVPLQQVQPAKTATTKRAKPVPVVAKRPGKAPARKPQGKKARPQ